MKKLLLFLFVFSITVCINPEKNNAAENLQAMIDSLEEGAVLKLEDKTYEGNIVINKELTLIGKANTVIKGDGTGNVISIKAPNVTLRKLTVTNSGMDRNSPEEYAGIKIHTNGNVVEHIKITDSFHGIYLSQAHDNKISYVEIKGMGKGKLPHKVMESMSITPTITSYQITPLKALVMECSSNMVTTMKAMKII